MNNHHWDIRARAVYRARFGILVSAVLMFLLFLPAAVSAVTIDGSSRSYLQTRESYSSNRLTPGFEYLDLAIGDAAGQDLSIHFGGWARYDFREETGKSDLQYAYVSYKRKYDNSIVNLGRVLVYEGVAEAERVDGGYARTDLMGNFSISAFGGVPAETGIDLPGNNIIYGGRLAHEMPNLYRIGISGLKEEKDNNDFRKEEGVDLWLRPIDKVELNGRSTYDSVTRGWMEHAYNLVLGPFDKFRLITDASRYDYGAFFRTATTTALQFSPGLLDPNEKARSVGEEVSFAATERLSISANYRFYRYTIAGNASSFGGRINYAVGSGTAAGVSVNRMDGDTERLKYTQFRVYGLQRIGKINIALDLIDVVFDERFAGSRNSYSASLAAAYDLTRSLRVGVDVEYLNNPLVERDLRAFAKIIYRFGVKLGGGAS